MLPFASHPTLVRRVLCMVYVAITLYIGWARRIENWKKFRRAFVAHRHTIKLKQNKNFLHLNFTHRSFDFVKDSSNNSLVNCSRDARLSTETRFCSWNRVYEGKAKSWKLIFSHTQKQRRRWHWKEPRVQLYLRTMRSWKEIASSLVISIFLRASEHIVISIDSRPNNLNRKCTTKEKKKLFINLSRSESHSAYTDRCRFRPNGVCKQFLFLFH